MGANFVPRTSEQQLVQTYPRFKMNYPDRTPKDGTTQLDALERELTDFQALQTTIDVQHELIARINATQQASKGHLAIKSACLTVVQLFGQMTEAEESSIFLLDDNGVVTESILARGATMRELKRTLIGQVLDRGLAGWVIQHRCIGLVEDTLTDDRWLTLPYEPYQVRSALCVPLSKGRRLLGVLTLMHSAPGHFNERSVVKYVENLAEVVALALDNVHLRCEVLPPDNEVSTPLDTPTVPTHDRTSSTGDLAFTGLYIVTANGKFLYVNPRFAEIFHYSFEELVALDSMFDLAASESRTQIFEALDRCFRGHVKGFACTFKGQTKYEEQIDLEIEGNRTKFYGKPAIVGTVRLVDR